jgi:hypothetical protein
MSLGWSPTKSSCRLGAKGGRDVEHPRRVREGLDPLPDGDRQLIEVWRVYHLEHVVDLLKDVEEMATGRILCRDLGGVSSQLLLPLA